MPAQQKDLLDQLLSSITESVDSTFSVVEGLSEDFSMKDKDDCPELVSNLIKTMDLTTPNTLNPVSLLSLKNSALLGYVTDLALLLAIRFQSLKVERDTDSNENSILNSIVTNRVVLEKGVKSLEKKINYQLEKMVNAYRRREKEQDDLDMKASQQISNSDSSVDEDEEEEEEEGLNFKPNPLALLSREKSEGRRATAGSDPDNEELTEENEQIEKKFSEKYKPPRISAAALNDPDKQTKSKKQRNLQSMDEYLQDISEAPTMEKSIGSTIINRGRDVKSRKQMEKEAEIQRYEEENFTRLPATKTKEDKRERAKRMRNEFFGEDWSMFDNNMDMNSNGSGNKKRKRISAWERAKRKIDD